jgi:hypothetical protein
MLTVELSADDLENNGQFAKIGGVARAIAKAKGVSNLLNSERKIFPRINAGVQSGALNPIDPETLEPLSKSDYGTGLVHFDELAEWGRSTKQFDFRIPASIDDQTRAMVVEGFSPETIVGAGVTAAKNRTNVRIDAIVETARQLKYDPMLVPYGGKAAIERECLEKLKSEPHRFTADTFKTAWQAARNANRIDVQNADIYRGQ